jgi:hypothetical protein
MSEERAGGQLHSAIERSAVSAELSLHVEAVESADGNFG